MDPADQLKQEVSCPICLEYFRDPVVTDCGHNFCRLCISRTWGGLGTGPCPQCRTLSQSSPMRPNRVLQRIAELVRQLHRNREKRAAPGKCPAHEEQLSLFCKEDQRALCVLCTMNFEHLDHCVQPLELAMSVTQATYTEDVRNPMLDFRNRTKYPASFKKLKEIVRTERARMLSGYHNLQTLLQEKKSFNLRQLDAVHHIIVTKQRKALLYQHDSLTSIFKSFRLSKGIRLKHQWAEHVFQIEPLKEHMVWTEQSQKNSRSAADGPQIERCLRGRMDATYLQADIGPTLSASTDKKKRASFRVGKKKMSSSSSDSDVGAEGQISYGRKTPLKKSTFSSQPWFSHELKYS